MHAWDRHQKALQHPTLHPKDLRRYQQATAHTRPQHVQLDKTHAASVITEAEMLWCEQGELEKKLGVHRSPVGGRRECGQAAHPALRPTAAWAAAASGPPPSPHIPRPSPDTQTQHVKTPQGKEEASESSLMKVAFQELRCSSRFRKESPPCIFAQKASRRNTHMAHLCGSFKRL